ncbi:MAG: hypothetical protein CMH64_01020 [Nanoarchaeota archaeon]|nr:hypothetical protein [Nanoarchaeota archaeon]|tara:strand:+ start:209 stop:769 length:561 start_codon:yes stop_codon:yes gene_type:complete
MEGNLYPIALGIILLSGYLTFRLLNHIFGYYREDKYLDKLLKYGLFGSFGFLAIYLPYRLYEPSDLVNAHLVILTPLFMISSFLIGCIYEKIWGFKKRRTSASLFQVYHRNYYKHGWVIVHLKDGQIFYGKLGLTDIHEPDKCVFSIKYGRKLDKHHKIIRKYKTNLVFDMENVFFMEYIKEKIKT